MNQVKIKFDRRGNVRRVVGNVGTTRMNRAASALWAGKIEPTTGYKLRRFIRRLGWTFDHYIDKCRRIATNEEPQDGEVSVIGLLEERI